jgi:hypothetical protein
LEQRNNSKDDIPHLEQNRMGFFKNEKTWQK